MPARKASPETSSTRKRKAHTKSRGGCGNCKLRRVKCDEAKPCCKRCKSYGVACAYDRVGSDLQPVGEGAFVVSAPQLEVNPMSMSQTFLGLLNDSLQRQAVKDRAWQLSNYDLVLLNKFHERSSLTIGNDKTRYIIRGEALKLAFRHSFLMHIALTFTIMHDRVELSDNKQTTTELFHWYQGVSEFNSKLSSPTLTSSERDAIWVSAALLGCTTIARVEGSTPEEVWPLKQPCSQDLDWIKMSEGKKEVWKVADLFRPDSTLKAMVQHLPNDFMGGMSDKEAFALLPPEFCDLFEITESSTPDNNPYYLLLSVTGRLLPIPANQTNLPKFMAFLSQMSPKFRLLLEQKDPRAMLLLVWYHAKASEQYRWWWWNRAMLEGQAMCIYLERHHADLPHLHKLLEYPKAHLHRCISPPGIGSSSPESDSTSSFTAATIGSIGVCPA